MASQHFANEDTASASVDGEESQWPGNQAPSTSNATAPISTAPDAAADPSTNTTPSALERLNAQVLTTDFEMFEPTKKHKTTLSFEHCIGSTVLQLANFWLFQGSPYDHVCLARANWPLFASCWNVGTFYSRVEFHLRLYAYILRRTSAIGILLARGYEALENGLSATDRAFAVVVEALVLKYENTLPYIVDWPVRGRPRTLMIDHPRLRRAIEIVMALPMRFSVSSKTGEGGKDLKEVVFFHFTGKDGEASWETEMEVVAPIDATWICKEEEYELPKAI